jgi:hypothetical protein
MGGDEGNEREPSDAEIKEGAKLRSAKYLQYFLWRVAVMFVVLVCVVVHYAHQAK